MGEIDLLACSSSKRFPYQGLRVVSSGWQRNYCARLQDGSASGWSNPILQGKYEERIRKLMMAKIRKIQLFLNGLRINTFKYHVFAPLGRFQLELIYIIRSQERHKL